MIVCPAQAQWYRRAVQALTSWKPGTRSLPLFSSKLDRKTLLAQQQFQRMQKSVVQLIINNHPQYGSLDDGLHSAFVIEENYRGTKYLWGVTAAHYLLIHPAIKVKGLDKTFPISIQASGAYRYTNIALFPIPQEAAPYVEPFLSKGPRTARRHSYFLWVLCRRISTSPQQKGTANHSFPISHFLSIYKPKPGRCMRRAGAQCEK